MATVQDRDDLLEAEMARVAELRATPRASLILFAALIRRDRAPERVRVRNISIGGAMIVVDALLAVGEMVQVELNGIGRVDASVTWVRGGRAGLTFAVGIDPALVRPAKLALV